MSTFSVDLAKFGHKAVFNAEKIVRKIVFDMHSSIVKRMPVDTGRALANTQISIHNLPYHSVLKTDKSGNATIFSGRQEVSRFNLGDTVFIYNNVEYVVALEFGTPKRPPVGMFRISFDEIVQHLGGVAV